MLIVFITIISINKTNPASSLISTKLVDTYQNTRFIFFIFRQAHVFFQQSSLDGLKTKAVEVLKV